jgi:hypothetical protein
LAECVEGGNRVLKILSILREGDGTGAWGKVK